MKHTSNIYTYFFALICLCIFSGCTRIQPSQLPLEPESNSIEEAIVTFEEKSLSSPLSENYVCVADLLWQQATEVDKQTVAYVATTCVDVVIHDNDLYSDSSLGVGTRIYLLEKNNEMWKVINFDDTIFPSQPKEPWVEKYLKLIPDNIKNSVDSILISAELSEKAGKMFHIDVAKYEFQSCKQDSECASGNVCVEHGASNSGDNKCMKTCSTHSECGKGYSCNGICAKGENGCPETIVHVCQPHLPHEDLDKGSEPW